MIKIRFLAIIAVSLFCFTKIVLPDTVVLKDGTVYQGTITGATDAAVTIKVESELKQVPHSEILSLVFTSADVLYLKLDTTLECKVVNKSGSDVVVVTANGVENIPNSKIRKVEYNVGRELKVASLPSTGPQFVNKSVKLVWTGNFKQNVYLGVRLGSHFAFLEDWKNQFTGNPSTTGLDVGGELGYVLSRNLSIGAGYEYFIYQKVEITSPSFKDRVSSSFIFASLKISHNPRSAPALFIYGGGDFGTLKGREKIEDLQGIDLEASASVFAFRIKLGVDYFLGGNTSISTELGYLSAKVTDLQALGQRIDKYSLDFSGLSFVGGVNFHFPISQ